MYIYTLCLRYLRSKYIALASIISVTLGVATLIVVNAVMQGFITEMLARLHGNLSDIILTSRDINGFPDPQRHIDFINRNCGDDIYAMSPTVRVPAMLSFRVGNGDEHRQVELVGIDVETYGKVCELNQFLQHPENRTKPDFSLKNDGYIVESDNGIVREEMEIAGWKYRKEYFAQSEKMHSSFLPPQSDVENPFAVAAEQGYDPTQKGRTFDPEKEQHTGIYLGYALSNYSRNVSETETGKNGKKLTEDRLCLIPGDDVMLTFPTAGSPPKGISDKFTVVDLFESGAMEFDARIIFAPIETIQKLRGLIDPSTGDARVSQILIKLKPGADMQAVRDKLAKLFPSQYYIVETWQEQQKVLLGAVYMETAILNVLLFLIIAVAGFGILAIFYMIVVEKTKDIGILKSLGASGGGVMQIFLFYSLSLGILGSGLGTLLGLIIVWNIQHIADFLSSMTGQKVFDPSIYVFYQIPTIIEPGTIAFVIFVTIMIAVAAGVLPALRAARMHPVEALRQ